jgi:hypothetical protein
MPNTNTKTQGKVPQQIVRGSEFKDVYSNVSRVGATPFDFSVTFGKIVEVPNVTNVIEDLIIVRFSPQQFKSLTDGLVRTLAAWERIFGEIKKTTPDLKDEKIEDLMKRLREQVSSNA